MCYGINMKTIIKKLNLKKKIYLLTYLKRITMNFHSMTEGNLIIMVYSDTSI